MDTHEERTQDRPTSAIDDGAALHDVELDLGSETRFCGACGRRYCLDA
jgi:hypothetical protein